MLLLTLAVQDFSCGQFGISDFTIFLTFSNIMCSFRSFLIGILYNELYMYKYVFYCKEKCFWSVTTWWVDDRKIQFPVYCPSVVIHQDIGHNTVIEQFGSERPMQTSGVTAFLKHKSLCGKKTKKLWRDIKENSDSSMFISRSLLWDCIYIRYL